MTILPVCARAQIPYFSSTVGNRKLYAYTSLKSFVKEDKFQSYSTIQYGIGNYLAAGMDLYTESGQRYGGILLRTGHKFSQWYGIGAQITPSFDLVGKFGFSYLTSSIYMNGSITSDGHLFWCSNTMWSVKKSSDNTIINWEYLGYSFSVDNGHKITPMIGAEHSWKFDKSIDIMLGFYCTIKRCNIYLWGDGFIKDRPRVVAGMDITF